MRRNRFEFDEDSFELLDNVKGIVYDCNDADDLIKLMNYLNRMEILYLSNEKGKNYIEVELGKLRVENNLLKRVIEDLKYNVSEWH